MAKKDKKEKINPNQWKIDLKKRFETEKDINIESLTNKEKEFYTSWLDQQKRKEKKDSKSSIQDIIERIKKNKDAQVDRIINKLISVEELKDKFKELSTKITAEAKKKILEKKRAKEERKKEIRLKLNASIPKLTKEIKTNQDKAEAIILKKQEEKALKIEEKRLWKAKHTEIQKNKAIRKLHSKQAITEKLNSTRTTKAERIAKKKEELNTNRDAYIKMMNEHAAAKIQMTDKQKEEKEKRIKRAEMLAKVRLDRTARKTAEKLKQEKKTQENIKRFLESQKIRLEKKKAKLSKYSGMQKKTNPEYPKGSWDDFVKNAEKKLMETKTRYIIRVGHLNETKNMITDSVGAFVCEPEKLQKRLTEAHNKHIQSEPDTYIGIYAYTGVGKTQVCVKEMIQDKFLEINRESTSRVTKNAVIAA